MNEGTVKWFNKKKNFGFIERRGEEDIFFHGSNISDPGFFEISKADRVHFELQNTRQGLQAVNVKVIR